MQAIQAADLSRRVEVHATDREFAALVVALNGLLDRLQRAFPSQRECAGSVSQMRNGEGTKHPLVHTHELDCET